MTKTFLSSRKELYKTEIKSETNNLVIADVSVGIGEKNLGFSPEELTEAALSACTSITLRMYANRKGWDLEEVKIETEFIDQNDKSVFTQKMELFGNLNKDQKFKLLEIANKCPMHRILLNPIKIITELKNTL
jgi:putative redox protein